MNRCTLLDGIISFLRQKEMLSEQNNNMGSAQTEGTLTDGHGGSWKLTLLLGNFHSQ